MNHEYACNVLLYGNRFVLKPFVNYGKFYGLLWFIHINTSRAQSWWIVTPSSYRETKPIQREMSPFIYCYLSKYHKRMDLHFMHAFDWMTDRSINALSGLLIKCVVIRYRCYWLKAVASSIILFLQFFNQIMPISVYQIVFYWLRWRVPLTWIFCYQFHCQKFIATSLLPCSFIH